MKASPWFVGRVRLRFSLLLLPGQQAASAPCTRESIGPQFRVIRLVNHIVLRQVMMAQRILETPQPVTTA
jgi:hypothetical protein